MAKEPFIELSTGERIPILYEDRSVLALDKPSEWLLAPDDWVRTGRNLQAALVASISARDFWARVRNIKFLRFIHRLDAETTGVVLFAKSAGAVHAYSRLFESRQMQKLYLAIVRGRPKDAEWICRLKLAPDSERRGKMKVDARHGKPAETAFRVLQSKGEFSLLEAHPLTGRTHQIRVHLTESGHPIVGDRLYGEASSKSTEEIGLRAVQLAYVDPFTKRHVEIEAPADDFLRKFGFGR
jgi:23S rRNA pseudouridine1911/1915/1917 synthase